MSTKFEAFTGDDSADDYAAMDMEARMTGPGSTRLKATVGRRLNHKTLITALVVCGVAVAAVVLLVGACVAVAAVLIARSNRAPQYVCSNSARKGDRCVDVVNFEKGAVSSDSAECSSLGVKIMRERGGNAMDAAVAVTLCLGLVHPFSSGIGGGNVILVFRPPKDQDGDDDDDGQYSPVHVFNAREKAPLEAHRDMFNDNPKDAQLGGRAIAVPGEISGLFEAWRKFGSHLDWEEVLEDVVEMAERGVTVNHMLANKLQTHREAIMANDEFKAVFAPTGVLLREGDVIKYEKLARTLRTIMEDGAESFYDTDHRLARDIVADVNDAGGIIREEDLQQYESEVSTEPAHIRYQGLDVYGPRAPFSGGPCVLMMLSLLENFDLSRLGNGYDAVHAMVEASKFAFAHRMVLGDPEFVNTTAPIVEKMLNAKYADELRRRMPSPKEGTSADPTHYGYENKLSLTSESHGTTHLNAVDSDGMTVAITSTINLEFGSFVMGSRTGILFNNEMDDFSIPNVTNAFNLPPSKENFIMPGKRPLSSMSPTIITKNGHLYMAVGASGGSRIISATLHAIINALHLEPDLGTAIAKARFHHQLLPNDLWIETPREFHGDKALFKKVVDVYGNYTHITGDGYIGVVQGIMVDPERGIRHAVSDWRKMGRADGY